MEANTKNNYILDMNYADSKEVFDLLNEFIIKKMADIDPIVSISAVPATNKELQRKGIDKIAQGFSDKLYKIEEKVRRKKYNDILFEIVADSRYGFYDPLMNSLIVTNSENKERAIGWALKDYECDLIVYYFADEKDGYIFSWKKMKYIIDKELPDWYILAEKGNVPGYSIRIAKNKDYNSINVAIPLNVFLKKYKEAGGFII